MGSNLKEKRNDITQSAVLSIEEIDEFDSLKDLSFERKQELISIVYEISLGIYKTCFNEGES